jgi:hypothetical protein
MDKINDVFISKIFDDLLRNGELTEEDVNEIDPQDEEANDGEVGMDIVLDMNILIVSLLKNVQAIQIT